MSPTIDMERVRDVRTLAEVEQTGKIEIVPIEAIQMERAYQRDMSHDWVQRHGEEYDPMKAGTVILNRRKNGSVWAIDGQHRIGAAKYANHTHMLALVFEGLSIQKEAEMRVAFNDRKADTPQDRFRARLIAGDELANDLVRLCTEFETRINPNPQQGAGLNCVGLLESLFKRDKGMTLTRVFDVIHRAFGSIGGKTGKGDLIRAIAWMLEVNADEKLDLNHLVDRMQAEGTEGILRRAQSHQAAVFGTFWMNTYRSLVEIYNMKLPQSRRLSLRTSARGPGRQARAARRQ